MLFNERIINLAESKFATFDVQLGFCADGPYAVSRVFIGVHMHWCGCSVFTKKIYTVSAHDRRIFTTGQRLHDGGTKRGMEGRFLVAENVEVNCNCGVSFTTGRGLLLYWLRRSEQRFTVLHLVDS